MGNRLTQNDNGALTNYTYDIANRLTSVSGQAYTWDNNGNLLNDGVGTYTYDQANRLRTLTQGANNYAFAYNGLSDRISQTVGVTQTRYALDPAAGLTQVLSDGTSTYLYGNGRIAQQQSTMQYFGADALGSVRQIYNSSGQVIANKRYDPYGSVLAQNGAGTSNYGYTGEWSQMFAVRILMFDSVTGEANTCEGCDWAGVSARAVRCAGNGASRRIACGGVGRRGTSGS